MRKIEAVQERELETVRMQRRWVPVVLGVFFTPLMVLTVSACSQDVAGSATTVVPVGATDFATIPPVITTAPGVSTTLPAGSVGYEQEYVVVSGDSPIKVANSYGVSVEELLMYNGWVSISQFPLPTQSMKIPPTAKSTSAQAIANTTLPPQGPSSKGCGTRPAGTYEVAPGDSLSKIGSVFCVKMAAIMAANGWYSQADVKLFAGQSIIIPAWAG